MQCDNMVNDATVGPDSDPGLTPSPEQVESLTETIGIDPNRVGPSISTEIMGENMVSLPQSVEVDSNPEDQKVNVEHASTSKEKISGYLEKKGKLRMVSSWKKYWFVLEGRLLLYYRSRADYDSLSPCKGSVTLGAPCNIKPGTATHCVFQIETRNHTITLRAENRMEQDKWMLAILGALNQNVPVSSPTKLCHFRYSADDLAGQEQSSKPPLVRQNTLPERLNDSQNIFSKKFKRKDKTNDPETLCEQQEQLEASLSADQQAQRSIVRRIQNIGGHCYISSLEQQDQLKVSKSSPKLPKNENLRKLLDKQESSPETWVGEEEPLLEMRDNELYIAAAEPKDSSTSISVVTGEEDERLKYAEAVVHPVPRQTYSDNIYQDITQDDIVDRTEEVIKDVVEYCMVDGIENRDKIQTCDSTEYKTQNDTKPLLPGNEPELPPRPHLEVGELAERHKKEKARRLRKLAKMVRDERKEAETAAVGSKRRSFVMRMFKKLKKNDTNKPKEETVAEHVQLVKTASPIKTKCVLRSCPSEKQDTPRVQEPSMSSQLVMELKDVLDALSNEQTEDLKEDHAGEEAKLEEMEQMQPVGSSNVATTDKVAEEQVSRNGASKPCASNEIVAEGMTENRAMPSPQEENQEEQLPLKEKHRNVVKSINSLDVSRSFDYNIYDTSKRLNIPRPKLITKSTRSKRSNAMPTWDSHYARYNHCENHEGRLVTIDKLLDDLENQHSRPFSRQKVKELIEKFNENDTDNEHDHSEDEWKVSAAHVIDNGDDGKELIRDTIAIRKRRLSEPDYDIPRPYEAEPTGETTDAEYKLHAGYFFGPDIMDQRNNSDSISCEGTSITPDSLEINPNQSQDKIYTPSVEEDRSMRSYTSHIYTSSESHAHANQCVGMNASAESSTADKDEVYANFKPPASLVVTKTQDEQADTLPIARKILVDRPHNYPNVLTNATKEQEVLTVSSMCLDSLESYQVQNLA